MTETSEDRMERWQVAERARYEQQKRDAAELAETIVFPEPDYVETVHRYRVDGPVITTDGYSKETFKVTRVSITVLPPDEESPDEPYIDVQLRGTKMKKDGTPDPRANPDSQYISDIVAQEAFKVAFLKTVGGG